MDDKPIPFPRLLRLEEVAELTQTPTSTLYQLISRGEGPESMKIGRNLRFHPDRVAEWLENLAETRKAS